MVNVVIILYIIYIYIIIIYIYYYIYIIRYIIYYLPYVSEFLPPNENSPEKKQCFLRQAKEDPGTQAEPAERRS